MVRSPKVDVFVPEYGPQRPPKREALPLSRNRVITVGICGRVVQIPERSCVTFRITLRELCRLMERPERSPLRLSTSQAAEALGVSLGTIRRWSDMGYLESYRTPGGQRRFNADQIDRFLARLQSDAEPRGSDRVAR
jgi:excisionase family DNA binding protein